MEFTPKNRATVQNMPKLPYAVEEALNRLRVNVSFLGSKVKKIMVISSAPDEGKSFIAMQLWRQMAEAGSKSILVVPDEPSSPNLAKNIILGAVVAMLLVAVIFVVRMLMDDSLNTAEDVEKEFGIMPFTVIPEGDIEEISDEVEKAISKEKKKRRKKK